MKTSETITKIIDALCKAHGQFKPVVKNKINPHFKSKFADLTSCLDSTRPQLIANGVVPSQGMIKTADGERLCVTKLMHTSGEWIETETPMVGPLTTMQAVGSAMTYARRYGYQGIVGINAEDDDDAEAAMERPLQIGEVKKPINIHPSLIGQQNDSDAIDAIYSKMEKKTAKSCEHVWKASQYNDKEDYCSLCKAKRAKVK